MFHQWKDEKVAALYVKTRPLLPQELGDRIVIYLKEKVSSLYLFAVQTLK